MSVTVTPLTPHVGVEIAGMSPRELVIREAADDCRAALQRHGVVASRWAHFDDDLVAFSRMLGEVAVVSTDEPDRPEIQTITLDPSKTNGLLGAYAAYEALPDADKAEIDDLRVLHSFAAAQQLANPDASPEERASWRRVPTRAHPLVWTHRDGRKSPLLGATAAEVEGWPAEKGGALLDWLLEWSTQPHFVLRHHWRRGDLVMWDNTRMLHRAPSFAPTSRRLLHRTTLGGEEAVA